MKKDITVFSLSALDLFCSAMGVFMIICFIVFPYYMKESPEPTPPPIPAPPEPQPEPPAPIPMPESIPSVTVSICWETRNSNTGNWSTCQSMHDVDLHVDAPGPNGRRLKYHCYAQEHTGSPAMLLVDSMNGGAEAWMHPNITAGTYKVGFKVSALHNGSKYDGLRVLLTIFSQNGTKNYPPVELTGNNYRASDDTLHHLKEFSVDNEGNISLP